MNRPSYLLFKKCSKCGEILHVSRYYKRKKCKYGVNSYCKQCQNNQNKEYKEKHEQEIKAKHEREKQELQARRDKNTAFVDDYLAKKEAEQKAIEEKKKKEAEQAEIYKHIEKLMETSPEAAKAYAEIYANKLKMI